MLKTTPRWAIGPQLPIRTLWTGPGADVRPARSPRVPLLQRGPSALRARARPNQTASARLRLAVRAWRWARCGYRSTQTSLPSRLSMRAHAALTADSSCRRLPCGSANTRRPARRRAVQLRRHHRRSSRTFASSLERSSGSGGQAARALRSSTSSRVRKESSRLEPGREPPLFIWPPHLLATKCRGTPQTNEILTEKDDRVAAITSNDLTLPSPTPLSVAWELIDQVKGLLTRATPA
jgi:hypothetical protein